MVNFSFEIISPDGIIFSNKIDEVTLPTENGEITILPNHAPIFSRLAEGAVKIKANGKEFLIGITGGFLRGANNEVSLLADYAIRGEDVERAKAEESKKQAERAMEGKKESVIAERDLKRSILELKMADKLRQKGNRSNF